MSNQEEAQKKTQESRLLADLEIAGDFPGAAGGSVQGEGSLGSI